MGAGCCGRVYEGDSGLLGLPRHPGKSPQNDESRPKIDLGYTSLPNRFAESPKVLSECGLAGLENFGNTCYINAALQCLLNCQPLIDYLLSGVYEEELNPFNPLGSQGDLTRAIANLTRAQWTEEYEVILPKHIVELIRDISPAFTPGVQHDAHEVLSLLLDQLHEDLNRATDRTPVMQQDPTSASDEKQAARAWAQHLKHDSSVIVDLFQGQLKSTLTCLRCSFKSVTFDTFMYLSLPIPKGSKRPTLEECLTEFTKEERLEKAWVCPVCQQQVEAAKKFDIWKVPPVLMFHLKRFHYTHTDHHKITAFVRYPIANFDLSPYITGPQKEQPVYDLFAKADHEGSLSQGHYSAVCKNHKTQKWYVFDDDRVETLDKVQLLTPRAYILFYHKTSVPEYGRQAENLPHLWPHIVSRECSPKHSVVGESLSTEQSALDLRLKAMQTSPPRVSQSST